MANINEEARIPVYINDEQAKSALKNLTSEAEKWRKKMFEAMAGGDLKGMKEAENELKKVNGQMASIKREAFDVNKVLQDISNASTKDLRKAMQAVNREMEGLNRNSKEYKDLMGKRNQIREEFSKINAPIKEQVGLLDNIKEMLPAMGWAALGAAGVAAFNKVIASTDELGTKWDAQMNGMKMASDEFFRTLATGDWSGFMDRMREAVKLGKEYVETLDDMEEKSRALSIIEANARAKELELEDKLRNKTLSKEERIKAGQERIQLEEDLAKKREQLAQQGYDAELKISMAESQLTKEQLETLMADFDSVDKQQAKKYLEAKARYDDLLQSEAGFREGQGRGITMANPFTAQLASVKTELDTFPESVKNYALAVSGAGKTTDEQLNKTVEAWVKLKEAQNSAVENTKRVRTQVNSLLVGQEENGTKIENKAAKARKEAFDKEQNDIESFQNWTMSKLIERYQTEGMTEQSFNNEKLVIEQAFLEMKLENTRKYNQETAQIEDQINQKRIESQRQFVAVMADLEKDMQNEDDEAAKLETQQIQKTIDETNAALEVKKEIQDKERQQLEERARMYSQISGTIVSSLSSMLDGSLDEYASYGDALILMALDVLKQLAPIWAAQIVGGSLATPDSIMTGGISGIAKFTAMLAIMEGFIAVAEGAVKKGIENKRQASKSYAYGGYTAAGDKFQPAGIVHAGEYVIPQEGVNNAAIRPIIDIIEMARQNGSLARIDMRPSIMTVSSNKSFASGGGTSPNQSFNPSVPQYSRDPELTAALNMNTKAIAMLMKNGVSFPLMTFKKQYEELNDLINQSGMGGFKE